MNPEQGFGAWLAKAQADSDKWKKALFAARALASIDAFLPTIQA